MSTEWAAFANANATRSVDGISGEARIVEGAVELHALGRAVKEWYPVVERVATAPLTTYNTATSQSGAAANVPVTAPFDRTYDVFDRMVQQILPDTTVPPTARCATPCSVETVRYEFALLPDYAGGIVMSKVTTTDPLGRAISRWVDVGGAVSATRTRPRRRTTRTRASTRWRHCRAAARCRRAHHRVDLHRRDGDDSLRLRPAGPPRRGRRRRRRRNGTHLRLQGQRHRRPTHLTAGSCNAPFGPSGDLLTVARANGTVASYGYDRDRLIELDYSDDTPTVTYDWGDDGEADNGAGRVIGVVDGAMERTYGYDAAATSIGKRRPRTTPRSASPRATSTRGRPMWAYDSIGRIEFLTYPDGEILEYDYDLGGRPTRLESDAPQHDLYDQYGNAVPRPDVEIMYIAEVRYDQFGEATYLRTGTGVETRYAVRADPTLPRGRSTPTRPPRPSTTGHCRPRDRCSASTTSTTRSATSATSSTGSTTCQRDTKVTDLGPPPVNNVPGPSQAAYTYDGHYRLIGAAANYVDRTELRKFNLQTDFADNGTLVSKRQVTTTTSTTSTTGTPKRGDSGNGKKGNGSRAAPGRRRRNRRASRTPAPAAGRSTRTRRPPT